eukprot:8440382-Alexandrium_andersonii.AAC.1
MCTGFSRSNGKGLCGLADCGLEPVSWRFRDLGPPRGPLSWADSESAREKAQSAPLGSFGDQ